MGISRRILSTGILEEDKNYTQISSQMHSDCCSGCPEACAKQGSEADAKTRRYLEPNSRLRALCSRLPGPSKTSAPSHRF